MPDKDPCSVEFQKLFPIQPLKELLLDPFSAPTCGRTRNNLQVLLQEVESGLEMVWFHATGQLSHAESVDMTHCSSPEKAQEFIQRWIDSTGFSTQPIQVCPFWVNEPFHVSLRVLKAGYVDFLLNPCYHTASAQERNERFQIIEEWVASGNFVLRWPPNQFGFTQEGDSAD